MPGLNTTIDASEALAVVIKQRYGRDIAGDLWSTVSPVADPLGGLGSSDTADWWLTLDEASKRVVGKGYQMSPISHPEAEAARTAKLDASVALLVKKAKAGPQAAAKAPVEADEKAPLSVGQGITLALGVTALTGALVAVASAIRNLLKRSKNAK